MKKRNKFSRLIERLVIITNILVMVLVENSANVTCSWIWGQPELSEEIKLQFRKF